MMEKQRLVVKGLLGNWQKLGVISRQGSSHEKSRGKTGGRGWLCAMSYADRKIPRVGWHRLRNGSTLAHDGK